MFSIYKSDKNGWAEIDCRRQFTKVSVCEVSLYHSLQDLNLKILYQSRKINFSVIYSSNEFRDIEETIVSVSGYVNTLLSANSTNFQVFSCEDIKEDQNNISYSYVCDNNIHCSNRRD